MNPIDVLIQNYFLSVRTPTVTEYMYIISKFFDFNVQFVLVVICISILIYLFKGRVLAWVFAGSIFSTGIIVSFLKLFFDTTRPVDAVMNVFGPSFPSYHATVVVVFFFVLMHIFDESLNFFWRVVLNSISASIIVLVSFSRMYLGVHWFSDVMAGLFLGSIIAYVSITIPNKFKLK